MPLIPHPQGDYLLLPVLSLSAALPSLTQDMQGFLSQRRLMLADVPRQTHPALRTIDTLQIVADELEELVGLASRASDPHLAMRSRDVSHTPDTSVRNADA
jgi:hypothetical protein